MQRSRFFAPFLGRERAGSTDDRLRGARKRLLGVSMVAPSRFQRSP